MSDLCHLVVHIDEVIERWCLLYRGPKVIQRYRACESLSETEREMVSTITEVWRSRLSDLSWFVRCLNEYIARRANREDNCTGHFREGRIKSQALLDEQALITAMAYVDLNPIRARMAKDLAGSKKTSVKEERLVEVTQQDEETVVPLMPFHGLASTSSQGLPFNLQDYLDLVDWTGRCVREDKRSSIDAKFPRILTQLGIAEEEWLPTVTQMQSRSESVMGSPDKMQAYACAKGGHFYLGYRDALK